MARGIPVGEEGLGKPVMKMEHRQHPHCRQPCCSVHQQVVGEPVHNHKKVPPPDCMEVSTDPLFWKYFLYSLPLGGWVLGKCKNLNACCGAPSVRVVLSGTWTSQTSHPGAPGCTHYPFQASMPFLEVVRHTFGTWLMETGLGGSAQQYSGSGDPDPPYAGRNYSSLTSCVSC